MFRHAPRLVWLGFGLFLLLVFALLLGLNMRRGLNHDEHQFLASGKLVATGLLPYRDFPYFHAPTLALIYGLIFRWFDPLLLSARLFSVLCAWLGVAVISGQAIALTPGQRWPLRLLLAVSIGLLLCAAPLFVYTSGRAWNHDLPVLLMLLAVVAYGKLPHPNPPLLREGTVNRQKKDLLLPNQWPPPLIGSGCPLGAGGVMRPLWLSGLLIGLAASVRLSFVFLAPAFLAAIWWEVFLTQRRKGAETQRKTLRLCILASLRFAFAFALGFAPALWFLVQAPTAFFFGNVEYVGLNTLYYRGLTETPLTMTLAGKAVYLLRLLIQEPGNLLLAASFVLALVGIARSHTPRGNAQPTLRVESTDKLHPTLIFFSLLFMLVSALIATPSQAQYYYVLWPLLALGIVYALAAWPLVAQRWAILGLSAVTLVAIGLAIPQYAPGVGDLLTPTAWYPHKLHRRAQTLATLVGPGRVLTLAPLYPLEGNVATYPALATGSFAWRVAGLVEPTRRERLGLFDPANLAANWQADPPRGVLVGSERDDAAAETSLVALAQAQGYVPVEVLDKQTLWLSPLAAWGGAIRLGAHTLPPTPLAPGESFQVVFYLQNVQPIGQNLNLLVRFVAADGAELLRSEGWPWGSATATWPQGEVWPDGHEFVIPAAAQAGVYGVEASFYDPATFAPLGEVVRVGQVVVG